MLGPCFSLQFLVSSRLHKHQLLTMDPSLDLVDFFRLEADFLPGSTRHTTFKSDRAHGKRKVKVVTIWSRNRDLGHGSYGKVWLETAEDGCERAVKGIAKEMCAREQIDYRRELAAMAKLSRVSNSQ